MTVREDERPARSKFAYCSLPPRPARRLSPGISGLRTRAILVNESKWVNGTVIRYYFFDRDSDGESVVLDDGSTEWRPWKTDEAHKALVREAFQAWKGIGIGLDFLEVDQREEAEVRIGFMPGDGAWSFVGREVLGHGVNERTMNFGWDLVNRLDGPDTDTAMHEIGHTLGLPHEHQNPNAGIVWDEDLVYVELAKPDNNWDREKTHWNIIRKIPPDTVQGSSWDPDSIMHYPFAPGLILQPERYRTEGLVPAGGLSQRDVTWIRTFYPPIEDQPLPRLDSRFSPSSCRSAPASSATLRFDRLPPGATRSARSANPTRSWCCSRTSTEPSDSVLETTTAARSATRPSWPSFSVVGTTCCESDCSTQPPRARLPP